MPDTAAPVDDIILDIQNIHRIYDWLASISIHACPYLRITR